VAAASHRSAQLEPRRRRGNLLVRAVIRGELNLKARDRQNATCPTINASGMVNAESVHIQVERAVTPLLRRPPRARAGTRMARGHHRDTTAQVCTRHPGQA
jgi:hypothetical protein